jgi:hypothetical protein
VKKNNKVPAFFLSWILVWVLVLFNLNAEGMAPPEATGNQAYAILSSDSLDLGLLQAGGNGMGSFTLTNGGNRSMVVARVRSSCGLLITSWPREALKPGEQATISFRYDTSRPGPFRRNIVIHTNARQGTLVVKITGEVASLTPKTSD